MGLFVGVELVEGFELEAEAGGDRAWSFSSNRSESALVFRARARARRTSRVGWLVPAS